MLAGTPFRERAEIRDDVREALDVGARPGRPTVAAMIDGIHGIAALDQLTSERLVATAVLGEAVRYHDDSPRRDPG